MFGVEYRRLPEAPVWHADVTAWEVLEQGRAIGRFFLDLFPREGKYKHAAQFTIASGVRDAAIPEGALVCNFPRPSADPALLEHGEVVTFFHEFGHLLHHLFGGHTRWAGVSGVRTEWDFVEAPSQMLEEWCWDASVLQRFARHVQTGEAIPAALIARMRAADEFGKGLRVRQQMFYAATSLRLHDRDPASTMRCRTSGSGSRKRWTTSPAWSPLCASSARATDSANGSSGRPSSSRNSGRASATSRDTRPSTTRTCGRS